MKKRILACAMSALLLAITSWADDKEKDEDRLKNAGTVLTEILNIPDDIPQDLLDKADCVVVFPSVLKAAFVCDDVPHGRQFQRPLGRALNDGP
jgi:lipid-binding SYLF domain-containing protein